MNKTAILLALAAAAIGGSASQAAEPPSTSAIKFSIQKDSEDGRRSKFSSLIEQLSERKGDGPASAILIQQFLNDEIQYLEDSDAWGVEDYWASPGELLAMGGGDCEDYAIAGYAALLSAGNPEGFARLAYARHFDATSDQPQAHMALLIGSPGRWNVVDSLEKKSRPLVERLDLEILFSFEIDFIYHEAGPDSFTNQARAKLSKWRKAIDKGIEEGWIPERLRRQPPPELKWRNPFTNFWRSP